MADQALGLLRPHLDDVQRNLAAHGDVPTTHDLERGIRLAQLAAAQALLRDHRRVEEAERSRADREPPAFEAIAKRLRTLSGQWPSLAVVPNDAPVGMLEGMLDGALSARRPDGSASGAGCVRFWRADGRLRAASRHPPLAPGRARRVKWRGSQRDKVT